MLWRRYTLLYTLVLPRSRSVIGWAGRSGLYSEYESPSLTGPGLALVMEGIHDGVFSLAEPDQAEGSGRNRRGRCGRDRGCFVD